MACFNTKKILLPYSEYYRIIDFCLFKNILRTSEAEKR